MADPIINCQRCGAPIELTQAVTQKVEATLKADFAAREKKLKTDYDAKLAAAEEENSDRLAQLKAELERKAEKKAKDAAAAQLQELSEQNAEQARTIDDARAEELALRKRARQVEEREKALTVELERRVDEARAAAFAQAQESIAQEQRLRDRERDLREEDLKKQVAVLKQKIEQGSMQTQGEAQEVELEELLKAAFPHDDIQPVSPGRRGGDVVQDVRTPGGRVAGRILWESKRTKEWSAGWVDKAKENQRAERAELAIIVTRAFPKGFKHFGCQEGVFVASMELAAGAGTALRAQMLALGTLRAAHEGKGEKMEVVYNYLTGPEFKGRVQSIVEPFVRMKEDLDSERRALERMWSRREKQLKAVLQSTAGLVGDVEGFSGVALPAFETLELPQGASSGPSVDDDLLASTPNN